MNTAKWIRNDERRGHTTTIWTYKKEAYGFGSMQPLAIPRLWFRQKKQHCPLLFLQEMEFLGFVAFTNMRFTFDL